MSDDKLVRRLYETPCTLSEEELDRAGALTRAAIQRHQAPYLEQLRSICEAIGYGRVMQAADRMWSEKDPRHESWLKGR